MRLTFEHGTVVVSEPPDLDLGFAPGLMWDPRVALWRAPARFHSDLVRALRAKKLPLDDRVRPRPSPRMPEWTTPELRPYQKGALMAWALAERRGLVVLPTGAGKTRVAVAALAGLRLPALSVVPTRAQPSRTTGVTPIDNPPSAVGCRGPVVETTSRSPVWP